MPTPGLTENPPSPSAGTGIGQGVNNGLQRAERAITSAADRLGLPQNPALPRQNLDEPLRPVVQDAVDNAVTRTNAQTRARQQEADRALEQRLGQEFHLADTTNPGTPLHARTDNPLRVIVNGQPVEITDLVIQRQPAADALGVAGARLVEVRQERNEAVRYSPLSHGPNESVRLPANRNYAVAIPVGNNRIQYIPLESFQGAPPAAPEPVIQPALAHPAEPTPQNVEPTPTPPSGPPTPREQLESRNLVIAGVKTKERRVYDLVNKGMERAKGWGKQAFKEVFEHKLKGYYSNLLDIAQSPFAEEAIRLAEQKGQAEYDAYYNSINPLRKIARKIIEEFKGIALKTTWAQDATIRALQDTQNQDIQAALARGRQMYLDEKGDFSGRFDTAFDREDLAVRKDMGEDFKRLDAANPFSQEIKTLIKQFTHGDIDEATFGTKKGELWGRIKTANPDFLKDAEDYADTLTAVGKQYKEQWARVANDQEGRNRIDGEIEAMRVALGIGQMGEATSMNKTDTQKATGKLREFYDFLFAKNIVGASLWNEATVGTAVSYALSVKSMGSMLVTSGARAVSGLAAGGAAAGLFGAAREKGRLTKEYWAYLGEREAGVQTTPGSKKREWFDQLDIKRRKSDELISALRTDLYETNGTLKTNLTDDEVRSTLGQLADAKARWALSSRKEKRVALIEIGGLGGQEKNRTEFVRTLDQAEKDLGSYITGHADIKARLMGGQEYDAFLTGLTATQTQILDKGKATFDGLQQDSAQRLALTQVAGYSPEVEKLRRKIAWLYGEKHAVGTASGLEAALKEFNTQANVEAARRGIATAGIGMGIGALTQEAIMDWKFSQANGWQGLDTFGHGGVATWIKELSGWGDGNVALIAQPELVGDHFVQHSQNLHFDPQGNMDMVKPDGTILQDNVITAQDISFDASGNFSQHTVDTLSAHGFHVGAGVDVLQPAHAAGTHDLFFGTDKVTVPNDLQWVDNGDGTSRLVMNLQDSSGNNFQQVIHANSVLTQGSPNDLADVIKDMHDSPLVEFTPGTETLAGNVPDMTTDIHGIPHITLADGTPHAISATVPTGTTLVETSNGVYNLVDANNPAHTLASGMHIDDTGLVTNLNAVNSSALAVENHIHITNTDYHVEVPGTGSASDFFDKPVIEMGQEKGFHGFWGWVEDPTNAANTTVDPFDSTQQIDLVNKIPITNYTKHLARTLYENDFSDIPGLKDAHFVRADGSIMPYSDIDARTYTMMYEGDTFKHLPDVMFKDDALIKIGSIAQKAINMVEQQGVDFDKATPAVLGITQQEFDILKSAYAIARVGREATKEEFLELYKYLEHPAGPMGLDLHGPEIAQQLVEVGPPAIDLTDELANNLIVSPLAEVPQIPIPIIPILGRRGLEPGTPAQPTPPEHRPITPFGYGGGYGYENLPYQGDQSVEYYRNWLNNTPFSHVDQEPYITMNNQLVHENGDAITRSVDRERQHIREYLSRQDPQYLEELRQRATEIGPMSEKTRAMMHLVMFQEEKYAYNALSQWRNQTANKDTWEITVLVNRRQSNQEDRTLEEVKRFQADHPEINVHVLHKVFPDATGGVGAARKYTTDLALLRSVNRPSQDGPLYILSEDAETNSVDPKTIERIIKKYDENPQFDALRGKQYFDDNVLRQNDLLKFDRYSNILVEHILRDKRLRPEVNENFSFFWNTVITGGWNTSFTADVYTQIDGYGTRPWLDQIGTTEDVDMGRRISLLRSNQTRNGIPVPNTHTIGTHPSKLRGSPRRFLHSLASGIGAYAHFDDEQVSAQIRHGDTDEMLKRILPVAKLSEENKGHFENYLTSAYNTLHSVTTDQALSKKLFSRYLLGVGIGKFKIETGTNGVQTRISTNNLSQTEPDWNDDYHIEPDGRVVLDNVDNFAYALEAYRAGQATKRPKIWEVKKVVAPATTTAQPTATRPVTTQTY